jgi:hypothetical protein
MAAPAMSVSLGRLSCPHSRRDGFRAADPEPWRKLLATNYWNPPTSTHQRRRQRILVVILAVALAAVLAQVGW